MDKAGRDSYQSFLETNRLERRSSERSEYRELPRPQADYDQTMRLMPMRNKSTQATAVDILPPAEGSVRTGATNDAVSGRTYDIGNGASASATNQRRCTSFISTLSPRAVESMPPLSLDHSIRDPIVNSRGRKHRIGNPNRAETLNSQGPEEFRGTTAHINPRYQISPELQFKCKRAHDRLSYSSWTKALEVQDAMIHLNKTLRKHLNCLTESPVMTDSSEDLPLNDNKTNSKQSMPPKQESAKSPRQQEMEILLAHAKAIITREVMMPIQRRIIRHMQRNVEEIIFLTEALNKMPGLIDNIYKKAYKTELNSKKK